MRNLIVVVVLAMATCCQVSQDKWAFAGRQSVGIKSAQGIDYQALGFKDTIHSFDSLFLQIQGMEIAGDKYSNDTMNIVRDSFAVTLSLYADIYEWQGCGAMPPTDLSPTGLPDGILTLAPPFYAGKFLVYSENKNQGIMSIETIFVVQ